ncbi:hypothetical protein CB1_001108097 [Camelus ferus]|nr:hypothetical protein CB1_001108097 [Camelus ferus]
MAESVSPCPGALRFAVIALRLAPGSPLLHSTLSSSRAQANHVHMPLGSDSIPALDYMVVSSSQDSLSYGWGWSMCCGRDLPDLGCCFWLADPSAWRRALNVVDGEEAQLSPGPLLICGSG